MALIQGSHLRQWKVQTLTESFATEKLEELLLAEQWEAALLLAETHALDTDVIHRYAISSLALMARRKMKHHIMHTLSDS